jgi:hypothetical protein
LTWLAPALVARGLTPHIENLGRINGTRALSLERRYVTSFFDECLKHRPSTVFGDTTPEPDVRIKRQPDDTLRRGCPIPRDPVVGAAISYPVGRTHEAALLPVTRSGQMPRATTRS